ncbi:MAG: haloacid dehalogenase superfamily protein [Adhaeribacter sp.]|nr:haloacid dehalogenase superfamily protein [Adhaeribacter sp.]
MNEKFAVIFDMDGVIIDSNPYHKEAWLQFAEKHNIELKEEEVGEKIFGKTNTTALRDVFGKEFSPEENMKLGEEKEAIYRELHEKDLVPIPGVRQYLERLKQNGIPMAVATNAPVSNVDFIMERTGLRHYFEVVIDSSSVKNGKPDPEIYLKSAEKLGMPPARCIVMEDSVPGAEAGLRAGMKVIAITTTHSKEELSQTHLVIEAYEELSLEKLVSLFH